MLTSDQVDQFKRDGFLVVKAAIDANTLRALRETTDDFIERSRRVTETDAVFELEPSHSFEHPRLRRLKHPVTLSDVYWQTATSDAVLDRVAALIGPNIKFHHSKLNLKAEEGGAEIGWHQDFAFFPHTNFDMLACGIALDDSTPENGCLTVVPGSHLKILSHRDESRAALTTLDEPLSTAPRW